MSNQIDPKHTTVPVQDARVHVAEAGVGTTVLLVHGFPETWWTFREVMALLADRHRVIAVDLPGFGDSPATAELDSAGMARVLAEVIEQLGAGPVHLLGQDVSGALTYRLAATRPDLVASWAAIETVLPGFGWEALADVAHGGAWYIGMLATPGVPELLLPDRERGFLERYVLRPQMRVSEALSEEALQEFVRTYRGPGGFAGAAGLYRSLLTEGADIAALARNPLGMPVLAVSGSAGEFVATSLRHVAPDLVHVQIPDVGHYLALEAPDAVAAELRAFYRTVDTTGEAVDATGTS